VPAGSRWRLLVHSDDGRRSHNVTSEPSDAKDSVSLPGALFDELVVDDWCHIEQMDSRKWWMNIGGVTVWVRVDKNGRPKCVDVYGPGDYAPAVEGVRYGGPALADEWPPK
jgi:hypothetical protein